MKEYQNKNVFDQRIAYFRNKIFNYGSKVPFILERTKEETANRKIFSVHDHKLQKLDVYFFLYKPSFKFLKNEEKHH